MEPLRDDKTKGDSSTLLKKSKPINIPKGLPKPFFSDKESSSEDVESLVLPKTPTKLKSKRIPRNQLQSKRIPRNHLFGESAAKANTTYQAADKLRVEFAELDKQIIKLDGKLVNWNAKIDKYAARISDLSYEKNKAQYNERKLRVEQNIETDPDDPKSASALFGQITTLQINQSAIRKQKIEPYTEQIKALESKQDEIEKKLQELHLQEFKPKGKTIIMPRNTNQEYERRALEQQRAARV